MVARIVTAEVKVAGCIGLAFVLRLWVLVHATVIDTDGVPYVGIARQSQQAGSPFDVLFHPLYPISIALVQPLVGDYESAGRLVSALFGSLLIAPAFAVLRSFTGSRVALLTVLLLVVHPAMVRSSTAVLAESLYAFLVMGGIWAAHRATAGSSSLLFVASALFGLAYLTRPEGAIYFGGLVVFVALRGSRSNRHPALTAVASIATFLLVAAPYLLYLRNALGYWTLTGKLVHNVLLDFELTFPGRPTDSQVLFAAVSDMPRHVLENSVAFQKYIMPELFPGVAILFLLPGFVTVILRDRARAILLLCMALPSFVVLAFHLDVRFFVAALPFLLSFVAQGIVATAAMIDERRWRRWAAAFVLVVALSIIPYTLRPILRPDRGELVYRRAAAWIAASFPRDTVLMDRKPFVAFYSDRRFVPLLPSGPDDLARVARRAGAQLVILDTRVLEDRAPLIPLVYAHPPAGLEVARDFEVGAHDRLRVLKVTGGG